MKPQIVPMAVGGLGCDELVYYLELADHGAGTYLVTSPISWCRRREADCQQSRAVICYQASGCHWFPGARTVLLPPAHTATSPPALGPARPRSCRAGSISTTLPSSSPSAMTKQCSMSAWP